MARISFRTAALIASFTGFAVMAACGGDKTNPSEPLILGTPSNALPSVFLCRATLATPSVSCVAVPSPAPSYIPAAELSPSASSNSLIVGGPGVNIDLVLTNVRIDRTSHRIEFDVALRNLRRQPLGTVDGITPDSSLAVFFHAGPTTIEGSGLVTISNAAGRKAFTASDQPYFTYGEVASQNVPTAGAHWTIEYEPTVTGFTFILLVSANVQYPAGYVDVFAASRSLAAGSTLQIQDSVRDALGVATASQSETWSLSDPGKATISSNGILTGIAPGPVTVTATQGSKTGSITIQVTGSSQSAH
jgi:hypothetical protein